MDFLAFAPWAELAGLWFPVKNNNEVSNLGRQLRLSLVTKAPPRSHAEPRFPWFLLGSCEGVKAPGTAGTGTGWGGTALLGTAHTLPDAQPCQLHSLRN